MSEDDPDQSWVWTYGLPAITHVEGNEFSFHASKSALVPQPTPSSHSVRPQKRDDDSLKSSMSEDDWNASFFRNGFSVHPERSGGFKFSAHESKSALVPQPTPRSIPVGHVRREQSKEANDVSAADMSPPTATPPSPDPDMVQVAVASEPAYAGLYLDLKDKTPESALVPPPGATPV